MAKRRGDAVPSWALCAGLVACCSAGGEPEVFADEVAIGLAIGGDSSHVEIATQADNGLVLWAVNAGGDEVVSRGVAYSADSATNRIASGGIDALVPV
jgi:hypothetical protein